MRREVEKHGSEEGERRREVKRQTGEEGERWKEDMNTKEGGKERGAREEVFGSFTWDIRYRSFVTLSLSRRLARVAIVI